MKSRGFASLSPERRREISSLGGKKVQELGVGHRFTAIEAKEAGAKGGKNGTGLSKVRIYNHSKHMNHLEGMLKRLETHRTGLLPPVEPMEPSKRFRASKETTESAGDIPRCLCRMGIVNLECNYNEPLLTLER